MRPYQTAGNIVLTANVSLENRTRIEVVSYQRVPGEDLEQRDEVVAIAQVLEQIVHPSANLATREGKRK